MKTTRSAGLAFALTLALFACNGDDELVTQAPDANPAAVTAPVDETPKAVDAPPAPKPSLEEKEGVTLPVVEGPKAFEPSQLAGLALWLRGDSGVTLDASQHVASWADRSPSHNDATAMMDVAPTMTKLPSSGLPAVQFSGTQLMTIADHASLQWKADFTVIVLASSAQKDGTQGWLYGKVSSSIPHAGPALIVNYASGKKQDLHVFAARVDENTASTWDNVNADDGSLHIFMMGRAGTTMFVSFDGEPVHTIDVGKAKDTTAVGELAVIGEGFDGTIGEVIALQHAVTEDETKAVVDYAVARYNPNK